jgi:uncharacterized protein (DUF1501 family)
MLAGGADSFNLLVPNINQCQGMNSKNQTVDQQYLIFRDVMALSYPNEFTQSISTVNQGQPCDSFVVHPELTFLKRLYDDGDLVFFANTGVVNQNAMTRSNFQMKARTQLFAHNAMQDETKKIDPYDIRTGTGVLGRAKDKLKLNGHIVDGMNIDQASILLDGVPGASDTSFVVPRGIVSTFARRPTTENYFDFEGHANDINGKVDGFSGMFADTWSENMLKGVDGAKALKVDLEQLATRNKLIWENGKPYQGSSLYQQLDVTAKLMQTHYSRKTDRDMFYVEFGGFDHHDAMKANLQPKMVSNLPNVGPFSFHFKSIHIIPNIVFLLTLSCHLQQELNANLERFVNQVKENGQWNSTVIYITSEFARTITPNSNAGSDHGT